MKAINMDASEARKQRTMKKSWSIETWMDNASLFLMVVLVFIPFIISFGSLQDLASANYVSFPVLFPLLVDGAQLIFKVLVIRASLYGRTDIYSWIMTAVMMVISVSLNIAHVPTESTQEGFSYGLARFMNALPPALIFLAFIAISERIKETAKTGRLIRTQEQLAEQLAQIKLDISTAEQAKQEALSAAEHAQIVANSGRTEVLSVSSEREQLEAHRDQLQREVDQLRDEAVRLRKRTQAEQKPVAPAGQPVLLPSENVGDKETAFLAFVKDNPLASLRQIGAAIGVSSPSTVSNYQKKLEEAGRLSKNGHWTVLGE